MNPIPIYLKTDEDMPRPADPEFYWLTRDGPYLCRNHPFFQSDVPARRPPRALAMHQPACQVRFPRLGIAALEFIIGFFSRVHELHRSESVVLLFWDPQRKRYRLCVPEQEATVWESFGGARSALDVRYTVPTDWLRRYLLVGDIHCHGDMAAYASTTDRLDEAHRDGVHAIVGTIDNEPPQFHQELAVDGHRFNLRFDEMFRGYRARRALVPLKWLSKVSIKVERAKWSAWTAKGYSSGYHDSWPGDSKKYRY